MVNEPARVAKTQQSGSDESTEQAARDFIFTNESSNKLDSVNTYGCVGLGQDCSGELAKACPDWRTDLDCQVTYWEGYMHRRYGTWAKAKAHWLARVPINGRDVGCWW